jgi:hypothetical protein
LFLHHYLIPSKEHSIIGYICSWKVQGFKEKGLKAGFISLISSIGSIGSNDQALGVRHQASGKIIDTDLVFS